MILKNIGFKFIGYFIIGIVFYLILLFINPWDYELTPSLFIEMSGELFVTWLGVILIMESGFIITKKLDEYFPWRSSIVKRILVQLSVQIVLVSLIFFILKLLMPYLFTDTTAFRQSFATGVILSLLLSTIFTAGSFFIQWNEATIRAAKYEKKVAQAELEHLKRQINPHFLFNNFSTLASLIEEDPQLAVEYVQRLSIIYRHVLKDEELHIVPLHDELDFINSYLFLYKMRYQESLIVTVDIPEDLMQKGIATATMQLLVENAIKHNSISRQNPLKIEIFTEDNFIVIRNNVNPIINPVDSTGIGLRNISYRYNLLSKKSIKIEHSEHTFLVKVPLLD
ncbi:histidine kinase [uncultured Dysgonomonas sp.]|uniref:Putative signal transduction histidine kinase n=1 Tax=uncultured Dysgonomonas sp. TaxID=206096 RepID=A0A212IT17_9BACT|nr:histidine kinase [uncultured Dysgonomonas sp.]SBV90361.1 putative signal transduction histidine kinase [uncultured Dysgonomonas sp.]